MRIFRKKTMVMIVILLSFANHLFSKDRALTATDGSVRQSEDIRIQQQTDRKTIRGTVIDANGEPIIGANVVEKNNPTNGAITDLDGAFSLQVPVNTVLLISYIGYVSQEVTVGNQTAVNVTLQEDTQSLEEVVVVGYGVQKKANLTGSVSSISAKSIESRPVTNVSSSLAGLSSGVYVKQSSGKPGSDGASIVVRGVGTLNSAYQGPLVIIDGVIGNIDTVNPNDIESISVLKDAASAAIYGSRAANGVILITTKKGKGGRVNLTYSGNVSLAKPNKLYETVNDYAYRMELLNESYTNIGEQKQFSDNFIKEWRDASLDPNGTSETYGVPNWLAYPNTNWNDALFENNIVQDHNLSASGGTDKVSFLLSLGYLDNPGIMDNSGLDRYQLRANVEAQINKYLKVGTQTFASLQNADVGDVTGTFDYLKQTTPSIVPYYDGRYGGTQSPLENASNVYHYLMSKRGDETQSRFNTTWYTQLDLFDGFSLEGRFNYQVFFTETKHTPTNAIDENDRWNFANNTIQTPGTVLGELQAYYSLYKNYSYTTEVLARYNKTFGKVHDISAFAGFQQYYYNYYSNNATKKGFISPDISTFNSVNEMVSINGEEADYATRSWFGRVNYAYKSKYLFEANLRYDGTSKFSPDSRWGTFPSFSAGWRILEESFMESFKSSFDNIKIRASWGKLGNVTSGYYDYQSIYSPVGYVLGNSLTTGLAQSKTPNPSLKWEQVNTYNIGFDFSTFKNRLSVEVDYYNRLTEGILTSPPIHLTMGTIGAPTKNTAELTNRGVEFSFAWNDKIGSVNYGVSGNFAYNHNEVTKYLGKFDAGWVTNSDDSKTYLSNLGEVSSVSGNQYTLEGHVINEFYLYNRYKGNGTYKNSDGTVNINGGPKDGMIRTQEDLEWVKGMQAAGYKFAPVNSVSKNQLYYGDFIYADLNGDGIYGNTHDREFTGKSATPKYTFGFNLYAEYKGIDLSMQWAGNAGMHYFWNEVNAYSTTITLRNAISADIAGNHYYYDEANPADPANNPTGKFPRLKRLDSQNNLSNDFWLHNASYLKLKNLQIGYTLPRQLTSKLFVERCRLYVTGENLLTISSYPGLDPEVGANLSYPTLRKYAFGINLTF